MQTFCNYIRHLAIFSGPLSAILGTGCVTSTMEPPPAESAIKTEVPSVPSDWVPVARYGRYTLVELTPQAAQHNLLLQVIDVSVPSTPHATVGDGLRYMLQRSGYSLCDDNPEVAELYELPLPAAHLQLGPIFLHDALQTLAGPAWDLQVDDVARQVCFTRTDAATPNPPHAEPPTAKSTRPFPAEEGDQP